MKLLFCGPLVPQALNTDFSKGHCCNRVDGAIRHRSGNGVQWPERMAVCVAKSPQGAESPPYRQL